MAASDNEPRSDQPTRGPWLYLALLAVQTLGASILFCIGIPVYRALVADPDAFQQRMDTLLATLSAIVLCQIGYWEHHRLRPRMPRLRNAVLGLVVEFGARLSFVLATSVFSFVFISGKMSGRLPVGRYVLTILALFSLFCYMQELQRLGKSIRGVRDE
jgi:hypothetical protein